VSFLNQVKQFVLLSFNDFCTFDVILPSVGALFQEVLDIGVILNALRAK
jgi:hypothetical protein